MCSRLKSIYQFYVDGFKSMKTGKTLWKIIFIKLVVILLILNYFVYDKSFKSEYKTVEQRTNFVYENLVGDVDGR